MSDPTNLSLNQQVEFLSKNNIRSDNLLCFKKDCYYKLSDIEHILDTNSVGFFSPIQYRVYSSDGNLVGAWKSCLGDLEETGILNNIPPIDTTNRWGDFNPVICFSNDTSVIKPLNCTIPDIKDYDFVIIAFWADYLGKQSIDMMKRLNDYVLKNKDSKILFLKVYYGENSPVDGR
jgi:hypothetical protein